MIDFTPRGIKKGGRVRKFFHEKSMTVEMSLEVGGDEMPEAYRSL